MATGDHPRVRGEHSVGMVMSSCSRGSSPRARGAQVFGVVGIALEGIIPACAGSTTSLPSERSTQRDHPRVRGEHKHSGTGFAADRGSSPRARGALRCRTTHDARCGIIPACAGSTRGHPIPDPEPEDHPRVRGEHPEPGATPQLHLGSSPRARGALGARVQLLAGGGIIPACAGSTPPGLVASALAGDHPRVRGEHSLATLSLALARGSSPRARGARRRARPARPTRGIIPACAGSTAMPHYARCAMWDHPRVRGEHIARFVSATLPAGSSPRARGALRVSVKRPGCQGIIPACAGSTITEQPVEMPSGDHPRVRGEHESDSQP